MYINPIRLYGIQPRKKYTQLKNSNSIKYKNNSTFDSKIQNYTNTNIIFKSNIQAELLDDKGNFISHDTTFFREPETDEFVQNYIRENFSSQDEINIVSGACSSGDEAKSYSMMLDDLEDKVKISGFDIDEKIIEVAKSPNCQLIKTQFGKDKPVLKKEKFLFLDENDYDLYPYHKKCKEKFFEYFSKDSSKQVPLHPIANKALEILQEEEQDERKLEKAKANFDQEMKKLGITNNIDFFEVHEESVMNLQHRANLYGTSETYIPKRKINNCEFKQGNVLELSKLYEPNSVDVLLLRNVLYSILCTQLRYGRTMKEDAPKIMETIAKQMNEVVKENGLVVFGKNEFSQAIDKSMIARIMEENGFVLLPNNLNYYDTENIWRKIENITE